MGYLGRRIGLSQGRADAGDPSGGASGGGILDLFANGYFQREGNIYNDPGLAPSGLTATGGVINDYSVSSDVYRAHIFTSSSTFVVSRLAEGDFPNNLEYLVVAGGGGGGGESSQSGGGGAGGFRTNLTGHPVKAADYTAEVATYTVTVGAGGLGGVGPAPSGAKAGLQGGNSEFFPTPVSYPSTKRVRAVGGGGGMGYTSSPVPGMNGGSGGGAVCSPSPYSGGTGNTTDPNHPQVQGYAGGDCTPAYGSPFAGGGGGGAGRVGAPDNPSTPLTRSTGGYGLQCLIAGPPANPQPIGAPGPGSGAAATGYFAGGGGGGAYSSAGYAGGYGGGATGGGPPGASRDGDHAASSTGGGGGGAGYDSNYGRGGNGGSGVVVVRYKIASVPGTAKATGGSVSYYGGKTIHTFTSSGTFATTSDWSAADVEYVVVAGGGGGGGTHGAGGGAGGYKTGTTPIGAHPVSTTIQVGAGGIAGYGFGATGVDTPGEQGTPSYFGTPITSTGGGEGSGGNNPAGGDGGSGGGGSGNGTASPGPANPPGQGNPGGNGSAGQGAGGGGAGAVGSNTSGATPAGDATGGAGLQVPTTYRNPLTTYDPDAQWYLAGGGGGGEYDPADTSGFNAGGSGGGGGGSKTGPINGTNGLTNTGGGGGGGGVFPSPIYRANGGAGGSGIVLIAYPT